MSGYSKGGYIRGGGVTLRLVAECSPDGKGSMSVIYADECFINKDRVCTRTDNLHAAVPGAVRSNRNRFWSCPLHD